ncbi:hypothetical protein TRIHO_02150 [Tritonibacter horizontis]|uniref:Translocase n=2 Tax=Tritonibacter horizontis TaxID=1768241 RepID=A0A132C2R8_9RHOB|nr:hypothetical protein TRIHO_02150 [Tritonibacter horizontis]
MGIRVTALTVAATVVCALATGLFMQKRADLRHTVVEETRQFAPGIPAEPDTAELDLQDVAFTSLTPTDDPSLSPPQEPSHTPQRCVGDMQLRSMPAALMQVDIDAPCHAGERFTLHHAGLMVTQRLDDAGRYRGTLPALAEHAVALADFPFGQDFEARTQIVGLENIDRVILQWQGANGFELHALEFGATYGEAGHVWHGAIPGLGAGQVLSLGDPAQVAPYLAQIYSLPMTEAPKSNSTVAISVEAEVTAENCDRTVVAQLFEHRRGEIRVQDLSLTMPDCSARGDFLVLNNLVETLRLTGN